MNKKRRLPEEDDTVYNLRKKFAVLCEEFIENELVQKKKAYNPSYIFPEQLQSAAKQANPDLMFVCKENYEFAPTQMSINCGEETMVE